MYSGQENLKEPVCPRPLPHPHSRMEAWAAVTYCMGRALVPDLPAACCQTCAAHRPVPSASPPPPGAPLLGENGRHACFARRSGTWVVARSCRFTGCKLHAAGFPAVLCSRSWPAPLPICVLIRRSADHDDLPSADPVDPPGPVSAAWSPSQPGRNSSATICLAWLAGLNTARHGCPCKFRPQLRPLQHAAGMGRRETGGRGPWPTTVKTRSGPPATTSRCCAEGSVGLLAHRPTGRGKKADGVTLCALWARAAAMAAVAAVAGGARPV